MAPATATSKKPDNVKVKKHTSRASSTSKPELDSPVSETNGAEPTYLKELQKSLRNAVKKLNATSKVDAIIAENPGKSLDELVEEHKINADQKAQALKKPALQAQVAQIEEQLGHYKQFAAQYEEKLANQKATLEKAHQEELEAVRGNVIADATETTAKALREQLLTLSKFLCAAAQSRHAGDAESPESQAFESVLFQVYGGHSDAVTAMLKLIDGADENVVGIEGNTLDMTYGDVKQACAKYAPAETAEAATEAAPTSDPTLANAGLTELQDTSVGAEATTTEAASGANLPTDQTAPPAQTLITEEGNQVAESTYDNKDMAASSGTIDSWVEVPRNPAETDNGLQATPANTDTNNATTGDTAGPKGQSARGRGGRGGRGRGEGFRGRGRGDVRGRGDFRGRGRGRRGGRGGSHGSPAATPVPQE